MPLITAFNLTKDDRLAEIEIALRGALVSMPELKINEWEVDLVPVIKADGFSGAVTRINVDLWERGERTKDALQELAARVARAFQGVAGSDRKVKVVIRPYDIGQSGWVSL
jgi:phenylpyruvate tautomerase PptA (4-oxalocrotonate tautomerase family)